MHLNGSIASVDPNVNPIKNSLHLGPYELQPAGPGRASIRFDNREVLLEGTFHNGNLNGDGKISYNGGGEMLDGETIKGLFEHGRLRDGIVIDPYTITGGRKESRTHSFGQDFTFAEFHKRSFSLQADKRNTYSAYWSLPDRKDFGIEKKVDDNRWRNPSNKRSPYPLGPAIDQGVFTEGFNILPQGNAYYDENDWKMGCHHFNTDEIYANLINEVANVHIRISKKKDDYPRIRVICADSDININSIEIDGYHYELGNGQNSILMIAAMLTGKQLTNLDNDVSVSLTGVRPLIEVMLTKIYYCHGPGI